MRLVEENKKLKKGRGKGGEKEREGEPRKGKEAREVGKEER